VCCHGSVPFNHDNMLGVRLTEELVNLDTDGRWSELTVTAALVRGLGTFEAFTPAELSELRDWIQRLRLPFLAAATADRCSALNGLIEEGVSRVHLVEHDGYSAHLHFGNEDADIVPRVKAMTAGCLAIFATETGASRMGACPRPGCGRVFADTSRNGRRVYCSARCGNSSAVNRFRDRAKPSW
jgi:predicted RNA-binding Zn ribbon-like protein